MEIRLWQIDALHLPQHYHIQDTDECYFLREYTKGIGWSGSETNDLINNFQKHPGFKNRPSVWKWKKWATERIAHEFCRTLNKDWLREATLVPIPPSKTKAHHEYDSRMTDLLIEICRLTAIDGDIRELIIQTRDMARSKSSEIRPSPEELQSNYMIDEALANPSPRQIGIFDDVLTAGSHFRAARQILEGRFPGIPIVGFFVARRIQPEEH